MRTEDVIRVARVPQRLAEAPRLRRGLEHWLADCDPARHGLPGDAIVLVRRLRTRWPVVLDTDPARRYAPFAALLAGARRAATAHADADADVVWFADEAELLACIARDALSGALSERWWWRVLQPGQLSRGPSVPAALGCWLQAPRQMPRAMQRLGEARALTWMVSLGEAGQAHLLGALARAYSLAPQLQGWVLEGARSMRVSDPAADRAPDRASPSPHDPLAVPATRAPAARAARLHRLSLALLRDAGAAAVWPPLQVLAAAEPPPAPARSSGSPATRTHAQHEAGTPAVTSPARERDRIDAATARVDPVPVGPLAADAALQPQKAVLDGDRCSPARATPSACWPIEATTAAAPAVCASATLRTGAQALAEGPPRTLLQTRHGGLLFLLNAALRLSLYGDFTAPGHRGLDGPPWRFLLLAGRAWCGPGWERDPLRAWLRHRSSGSHHAVPLSVWPELHARLAQALDDGQPGIKPRQRLRAMLGLPARLQDAGERLDLHFALAELPLAVRLAGLDRDPGWIPAAGCDVRFHFD